MRLYDNFIEAFEEIGRELNEMGVVIDSNQWQGKLRNDVVKELICYSYGIKEITTEKINEVIKILVLNNHYISTEISDRIMDDLNPGNSYKYREDVWKEHLRNDKFDYTYSERIGLKSFHRIINQIKDESSSRRLLIPIYDPSIDLKAELEHKRIPCSMYYQLLIRNDRIHLIYNMRSCDYITHFMYDVILACKLIPLICYAVPRYRPGNFYHVIGSFHEFERNVQEKF